MPRSSRLVIYNKRGALCSALGTIYRDVEIRIVRKEEFKTWRFCTKSYVFDVHLVHYRAIFSKKCIILYQISLFSCIFGKLSHLCSRFTADALTFVLNSISNIDSVHYKNFVIFRFDNHFWNFLDFFEDLLILIL